MKKTLKVLAITIIFCIIVTTVKDEYENKLLIEANFGLPALISQREIDNLFIGSSMFRQGIDIEQLKEINEKTYILAYNGNQPVIEKWLLEYLIDNHVEIGTLYVDMYVYSAYEEPELNDEKLFMEVDLRGKWQLWQIIKKSSNTSIGHWIRLFVTGNNEMLLTWPIQSRIVNQRFESGGNITESQGMSKEQTEVLEVPQIVGSMDANQREAIKEIIYIARNNNIQIVFLETPKYHMVTENIEYKNAIKEYETILEEENVKYILAEDVFEGMDEADNFIDLLHMSSKGRRIYTRAVCSEWKQYSSER